MTNLTSLPAAGMRTEQTGYQPLRPPAFGAHDTSRAESPPAAQVPAGCSTPKSKCVAQVADPFSDLASRWNIFKGGKHPNHVRIQLFAFEEWPTQQREFADAVLAGSDGASLIRAKGFQPLLGLLERAVGANHGRPLDFVELSMHGSSGVLADGTRQHPGRQVPVGQLLNEMMGRGFIASGRTTITLNACNVAGTKAGREKLWNLAQLLNINIVASPSLQYVGQRSMNNPMTFFHNGAVSGLDAKERSGYGYMSLQDATR